MATTTNSSPAGLFSPLNIANLLNSLNNGGGSSSSSSATSSSAALLPSFTTAAMNSSSTISNSTITNNVRHAPNPDQRWTKAQMDAAVAAASILLAITGNNAGSTTGGGQIKAENASGGGTGKMEPPEAEDATSNASSASSPPIGGGPDEDREDAGSPRGNQWIHLGAFDSEQEMQNVRNKEKVSKRRTEQLKNGVKVRYRCNTWKRTKCGFQMFSFQHADTGLIDLYECGSHDHSGRRKIEYDLLGPLARRKATPLPIINGHKVEKSGGGGGGGGGLTKSGCPRPPKQLRMMAEQRALTEMAVAAVAAASASSPADQPWPFSVTESAKLDELRTLARQNGLRLERNSDIQLTIYRLSANGGRGPFLLVIVDSADAVTLSAAAGAGTIFSPSGGGQQRWAKGDWPQFLWAARAVFAHLNAHCPQHPPQQPQAPPPPQAQPQALLQQQ